jgi:hypothetical protein
MTFLPGQCPEDKDGQYHCPSSEPATVTVTPTACETGISSQPIETPVVALGDCHRDHSDDDRSELADSLIHLSCPMSPTANVTPTAMQNKRMSPIMKFIVDGDNNYSTDDIPITNITLLPLSKLIMFCQSSFKCCNCNSVSGKLYTRERYGID